MSSSPPPLSNKSLTLYLVRIFLCRIRRDPHSDEHLKPTLQTQTLYIRNNQDCHEFPVWGSIMLLGDICEYAVWP